MSYISNGCNDCSTVDFGMQNMNPMGQLTGGYGMNNNNNGYGTGGQLAIQPESVGMQMTSTANPYIYQQQSQQPHQIVVQQEQVQMPVQQMVKQPQVVNVPAQPKMMPVQQVPAKNNNQTGKTLQGTVGAYFTGTNFSIMLAFLVASAWHETIRYYINQAIKFNGGTPTYYIVYAVIATLASIFLSSMQ
jgi:hypothetical protein